MQEAVTLEIGIAKPWRALYDAIWRPEFFPRWASGLSRSLLEPEGNRWRAEGPEGTVWIRFTPYNAFGVMDHHVDASKASSVYIPLRVIANGTGAQVILTLFRQHGMPDEKFQADQDWVRSDLEALKALMGA